MSFSRYQMRAIEGLSPQTYDRTMLGTVVLVNGTVKVNVQGNNLNATWFDPVTVVIGDTVIVQLIVGKTGTEAIVRGKVSTRYKPADGVVAVVPPSSQTVSVTGNDGVTYTAKFLTSYTPVVGESVILSWWGGQYPIITGKLGGTPSPAPPPPPPPPPAPPPAPPQTGVAVYVAQETNTLWGPGGWGSWAGGNGRVFQGQYGSGQVYGAAFYHGSPTQLQGRAIDRVRFTLGPRMTVGAYNSGVPVHVFLTTNAHRPAGDVTLIDGAFDVWADPGQGLRDYDLPVSWGAHFLNGAGLSFRGDPYAGFRGRNEHPDAFKLILDWRM